MKNTQKGSAAPVVFGVLAVIGVGLGVGAYYAEIKSEPVKPEVEKTEVAQESAASDCGLVPSLAPNSTVTFPLTITGKINLTNGCKWVVFEGLAGTAQLQVESANGWEAVTKEPVHVTDWLSKKTTFSVTLNFNNSVAGFSSGTKMRVVFSAENPSGIPEKQLTAILPIVLK